MKNRFYFTQERPRTGDYPVAFLYPDASKYMYIRFLNQLSQSIRNQIGEELEDLSTVMGVRIHLRTKGYTEVIEQYVKKIMVME